MNDKIPEMHKVASSNIRAIGYCNESKSTYVEFTNNMRVKYNDVSEEEFKALKNAQSIGAHLHRNFKSKHSFTYY